jgi:CelD/BcsL family acetyltransferase involved in cellulose biosynthesis
MSDPRAMWDVVVLQQFVESSPTLTAFDRIARRDGWRTGRWTGPPSPYIRLECDYETLFNRLRTRERYHLRKRYAKLAEVGNVDMEIVSSREEVAAAMEDGLRIEAAAWKGAAGTAMLSDPVVRDFYLKFAERAADRGVLRLAFLRVDGKRIAFLYMLDSDGVIHAMKVGYDPAYHSYSPGHTLLTFVLRQACREGRKELDFQGIKERWKLVWTNDARTYPWLFMFRDNLRGWLLHQAKFVLLPVWRKKRSK